MSKNINKELKKNKIDLDTIEFENIVHYKDEIWKELKTDLYPEILDYYMISNKNRIYSFKSKKLLSIKIKSTGYYIVSLQCHFICNDKEISISKYFGMHRLMMIIFNPVKNMKNLFVNHKDGNKSNNDLSNLEWTTPKENAIHASKTGLLKPLFGESHKDSTITENQAYKICDLWLSGFYKKKEIADIVGTTHSIVMDITNGVSWKHVTKKYDFTKRPVYNTLKRFNENDIRTFCKYFVLNKKNNDESVNSYIIRAIKNLNFKPLNGIVDQNLIYSIRAIYDRKNYTKVSKDYNF